MAQICIIEDDPAFSAALQRIISQEHEVHCFSEVPEDPEEILSLRPDIIFLDCMLPGETGPTFLQRLRSDDRTREVAVILMSAYHEMMEEARLMTHEYQEFLKKPCTIRQVMALVHRYVGQEPTGSSA